MVLPNTTVTIETRDKEYEQAAREETDAFQKYYTL